MVEDLGLVNSDQPATLTGILRRGPLALLTADSRPAAGFSAAGYCGLTTVDMLKVGAAKGCTRAFLKALSMQAAAAVPAAGPETLTLVTLPSELKTMRAVEASSCPAT